MPVVAPASVPGMPSDIPAVVPPRGPLAARRATGLLLTGCAASLARPLWRKRALWLILAVGAASALPAPAVAQDAGAARPVVRDSAGVVVVENGEGGLWPDGAAWRLSEAPVLQIGSVDGPPMTQLHAVVGAVRLSDGRVVVADGGSGQLRFFAPDGQPLSAVGGVGGGPGEFAPAYAGASGLTTLARTAGDTLRAYDVMARRVTVFGPEGDLVRTTTLETPGEGLSGYVLVGWLEGGGFVGAATRTGGVEKPSPGAGVWRLDRSLLFYRPDGSLVATAGPFPGDEMYMAISATDESGRFNVSMSSRPFLKSLEAAATGGRAAVGPTDAYEIRLYGPDGTLRRIVRGSGGPRPAGERHVEAWIEERLARADDEAERRRLRREFRDMSVPEELPAFETLRLDAEGRLWVREYDPPGRREGPARWSVFDPQGRRLGWVEMPRSFRPLEIGGDHVLGLWRDELDVEHVRLYRLLRPGG